jgi:hypothetical protein
MKKAIMIGLAALLTGCATPREREVYKITDLTIVLDTYEGINQSYQNFTLGQRPDDIVSGFQVEHQIYSVHDDDETLGHELRHMMEGKYHPDYRK